MLFFKDYAIMSNTDIESARRTIDKEIDALRIMESELDENLTKALDMMQSVKGRVIVTGMGKSGHIGQKIAATLASTGHAFVFRPSGGSQPRRPGHADQRRRGAGHFQRRRIQRTVRHSDLLQKIRYPAHLNDQKPGQHARQSGRHRASAAGRRGSLPARTGADVFHHRPPWCWATFWQLR